MSNPDTHAGSSAAAQLETVEQALGELEMADLGTDEVIEALEPIAEMDAEQERTVEAAIARSEVYEESEAPALLTESTETIAPAKKAKTIGGAKRTPRDVNTLDASAFVLSTTAPADLEANKVAVLSKRPKQVKIAEKFDNVLSALAVGKAPSIYVTTCFQTLLAAGTVKSADLVAAIQASTTKIGGAKKIGTARSQAGQIMFLFDLLGIAIRTGNTLTLNGDSALAVKLAAL